MEVRKGTTNGRAAEENIVLNQTWICTVSLIPICLRYLVSSSSVQWKVKLVDEMKNDNYTMLGPYLLTATSCRVIEIKTGDKMIVQFREAMMQR